MFSTRNLHYGIIFFISLVSYVKLKPCADLPKLKILPGFGWDALKDKDTKQLLQVTYDQCKTTFDGKLLIPDNADAFALKSQEIEVKSSIFEHWSTYIPPTSASFKIATNVWPKEFLPLYYSFSEDYQQMKSLQFKKKTFTCRSEMRQVVYRVHLTELMDDSVKGRFMEVIGALLRDKNEEAKTLTEKIVSDYGSHYSNIVDVGAVIIKEDYLKDDFLRAYDGNRRKILSASKLSLLAIGFPWEYTEDLDSSLLNEYNDAIVDKKIRFFGALNWKKDANAEYVVAVDKSGNLLSSLVTSSNFPYYPNTTSTMLIRVRQMINEAIRDYYVRNIHRGCTQPKSNNFEFAANVDDGSCCNSLTSSNYVNLEKIIERQETEISSFKQQIIDMKLNHRMKIEELEGNLGTNVEYLTKMLDQQSKQMQKLEENLKIHRDEMIQNADISRLKQIDLEEIIQRQETEISLFKQQMVYHGSNHSMKIQNLEDNFGKIIKRQEMAFKQQMVYHESNHSMKIQDLEDNFGKIIKKQEMEFKQQMVYHESNHSMKIQDLEDNFGKIIERQETKISLFKQQMVHHESNHSMKIQDLEDNFGKIIKRQEMEFKQQMVYHESNHRMKIQDLEDKFGNLEKIINGQKTEISLFKQQMVYHESNHSMNIQDLEDNFVSVAQMLDRQSNNSKQIQKLLESSELQTRKLTKQQNDHFVKIEICEKSLTTISTANNELAMAVAENKKMLSNKIDKLEKDCTHQQNEMKGKLGNLENQAKKKIIMDQKNQLTSLQYMWKVDNFSQLPPKDIYSDPFYTSEFGYKMGLMFYKTESLLYLSMLLYIMEGPYDAILNWPLECRVRFSVLDQSKHKDHHTVNFRVNFDKPVDIDTDTSEIYILISLDKLKPLYLLDDTIFFKLDLTVTS
uniref:MATH domain-containing protein n=1 Tax=Strigamia maritima TaxID=126957 RepID=T1JC19_STRMM